MSKDTFTTLGWQPIETAPKWDVVVVTDGERATTASLAESDWGGTYWAIEPEDSLDWEPTHWMLLPEAPSLASQGAN